MLSKFPEKFCLSFDLDWAADFILDDLFSLLSQTNLKTTLFTTHKSEGVDKLCSLPQTELALHPNFLLNEPDEEIFARLKQQFPDALGVRNHVLYYHSRLLPLFHAEGIRYFSNELRFLENGLEPYYDWSGLIRLPIFWEDDVHCIYFNKQFDLQTLLNPISPLKVLNFHPVHIYLNTTELSDYEVAKADLKNKDAAIKHRKNGPGIRTLFIDLLEHLKNNPPAHLLEIAEIFRKDQSYTGQFDRFVGDG
jgi:hypothetical protein